MFSSVREILRYIERVSSRKSECTVCYWGARMSIPFRIHISYVAYTDCIHYQLTQLTHPRLNIMESAEPLLYILFFFCCARHALRHNNVSQSGKRKSRYFRLIFSYFLFPSGFPIIPPLNLYHPSFHFCLRAYSARLYVLIHFNSAWLYFYGVVYLYIYTRCAESVKFSITEKPRAIGLRRIQLIN